MEEKKKFQITRGMLILTILVVLILIVIIMIIIKSVQNSKPKYTAADFKNLENRMVEESYIYLSQNNITLTTEQVTIKLSSLLEKNGGGIVESKVTKICAGYVIAQKLEKENYTAYLNCGKNYKTPGYISNDNKVTTHKVTSAKDKVAPVITINGLTEMNVAFASEYKDQGAVAIDNKDGNITSKIITEGKVDTLTSGMYEIVYRVSDKAGNKARVKRKVIVLPGVTTIPVIVTTTGITNRPITTRTNQPTRTTTRKITVTTTTKVTTPPRITILGDNPTILNVGQSYFDGGFSATDVTGKNINSSVSVNSSVNTAVAGTYYVTYTVKDAWQNQTSARRTVIVKSTYIPVTGFTLTPNSVELEVGNTKVIFASITPSNATNKSISWGSSNEAVASVSNGTITARARGKAVITASAADGKTATIVVNVK